MQESDQSIDPVGSVTSENSTTIVEEHKELESQVNPKTPKYVKVNHFEDQIIGDKGKCVMTRRRLDAEEVCLISQIEPESFIEACKDENWMKAMEDKLNQIGKNNTWELVPRLKDKNVIRTKWVFRNKLNEGGHVVMKKDRL